MKRRIKVLAVIMAAVLMVSGEAVRYMRMV